MITESTDGAIERQILIGFITNKDFLLRISPKWDRSFLQSKYSQQIASLCVKFSTQYSQAPNKNIIPIFQEWSQNNQDKNTISLMERFLGSLSNEYDSTETTNTEYLIKLAESHFNSVRLYNLKEEISQCLEKGEVDRALELQKNFRKIDLTPKPYIDVIRDKEIQRKALEDKQNVLIKFPGPAGEFFGEEFSEDSFIGYVGAMKGGKSYSLLDCAWRAMRQGKRVGYFQVGDLSLNQIMRRFHKRAAYRPINPKIVRYPIGISIPGQFKEVAQVSYEDRIFENFLSWPMAERAFEKIANKNNECLLRLSRHSTKSISILDIKNILAEWEKEGWTAQVIVIDYMNNLLPTNYKMNEVNQVSETWAIGRQISEENKRCVITAEQSNKEGFKSYILTKSNFSNSKMMFAHVTAAIGINATDEERSLGIMRYNYIVRRENAFTESQCLFCASCLDVCNPLVVSCMK